MGLIARIKDSFTGKDGEPAAKVEIYKGDNATARVFNPPGDDSRPLDGDICFTEDSEDTEGGKDITGFIDQKNAPVSEKGEKRLYSRDADGNIVATVHLKKDGTIQIDVDKDFISNIGGKYTFITQDDFKVQVASGKKISFGNGTDEVLDIIDRILTELQKPVDAPGVASTGSLGLINPALALIQTALGNIKV